MNGNLFRFRSVVTLRESVNPIAVVTATCAAQQGAISTLQLRAAELTPKARRGAEERGWLRPAAPGVYVVAGSPDTWMRRLQIGLLSLGPRAWVSHESAAVLWGFDRCLDQPLHLTVPRELRFHALPAPYVVHTTGLIGPHDVLERRRLPCSSATRTILDLATLGVPRVRLGASIDSAVRDHHSSPTVLAERLSTLRGSGRAGVRLIDRLLPDSGGETILERAFLGLVRRAGLPRPNTQRRVYDRRRHVGRVDFSYDELRIVVEVTGRKGHASDEERLRDAQRRNELQDVGLRVYEYTSADVRDRPAFVVSSLRTRLEHAMSFKSAHSSQPGVRA